MPNLSVNISGYSAIVADSITSSGPVVGTRFGATTDGSAANPAFYWTNDENNGLWRDSADHIRAGVGGSTSLIISAATGIHTNTQLTVDNGNLIMGTGRKLILDTSTDTTSLALQFNGDPNLGIYRSNTDNMDMVANGGSVARALASTWNVLGNGLFENAIGINESSAPSATANRSWLYSLDVGSKTQLTAKQGSAGTVVALAIEV